MEAMSIHSPQPILTCLVGKARLEISAEEHEFATGPYTLVLTLPDSRLSVTDISRAELEGLSRQLGELEQGPNAGRERWDGQSGG